MRLDPWLACPMTAERREHIDEQPRFMDWEAELKALLRTKGYELAEPLEFLGTTNRKPDDERWGHRTTTEPA